MHYYVDMDNHPEDSSQTDDDAAEWASAPDPILSSLSGAADAVGVSLTVLVSGATVEGELINAKKFFELEREALAANARFKNVSEDSQPLVMELFDTVLSVPDQNELPEAVQDLPRRFIHLSNVSITGAGFTAGIPGTKNRLRIPIEKVSGWALGRS